MSKPFALRLILRASSPFCFVITKLRGAHFFPVSKVFTVFLALILATPQAYSQSQEKKNENQIFIENPEDLKLQISLEEAKSLPPISLEISDPKPASEITESEISSGNTLFMLSADIYNEIRHSLDTRFWQPLKNKSQKAYGYMALNIPRVANDLKEAFRHPLKSGKNVTIVTTVLGITSTVVSFTAGNISTDGNIDMTQIAVRGVLLAILSGFYRANFDSIGSFLTYTGWSRADIKKSSELQNIYEENIKNLKDEKPAGLVEDSLKNRIAKSALIEVFFLAAATGIDLLFPKPETSSNKSSKWAGAHYTFANIEYTFSNFVDALLTRKMIEEKVKVKASTPEEIELKQNKISFIVKILSIALGAAQNYLVVKAISGDFKAHLALGAFGGSVVLYEYISTRKNKNASQGLNCSSVFAH